MAQYPLSLRLTGAAVLHEDALQARSLSMADGRICEGPLPEVNLSGYYILPGIIDLHGDAFERHIAPRPTAPFAPQIGLANTDRDAAANGITTAWLAQSWSWEGGRRGADYAETVLQELEVYRAQMLTDLRVQIRLETHVVDDHDRVLDAIARYTIDYVIFNNHLDEALALCEENPARLDGWAADAGRTGEEHMKIVHAAMERGPDVPRHLCALAEAFDKRGVSYGSHDDGDGETREFYAMLGAKICEFPTSRRAAKAAHAMGDPVLLGAPNVVRGVSQSGNISARELIRDNLCDALVSDYYYPALARAAWKMVDDGALDLPHAWAMISQNPADILRLHDRGRLDVGKRADFVVVNQETRSIEATVTGGRFSYLAGDAANRFLAAGPAIVLAAQ